MKRFQDESRYHDDDPEDDMFHEYSDETLDDLVAHLTRLPPHAPLEPLQPFTVGMGSMGGMISMTQEGMLATMQGMSPQAEAINIAGQFKITPTGEILLRPTNQDMRQVAGLSGDFKITADGIIFIPK